MIRMLLQNLIRRFTKQSRLLKFTKDVSCVVTQPASYDKASKFKEQNQAIRDAMAMINKNKTWQLTDKPKNKHVIGVKWVYQIILSEWINSKVQGQTYC